MVISGMKTTFYPKYMKSTCVRIALWNIIFFTVFKTNEYSLYKSIPADGSIPAVTYYILCRWPWRVSTSRSTTGRTTSSWRSRSSPFTSSSPTGSPVKHGCVFLVHCKSDFSSVRYCTPVHWTSRFLQGTINTQPCLTGHTAWLFLPMRLISTTLLLKSCIWIVKTCLKCP